MAGSKVNKRRTLTAKQKAQRNKQAAIKRAETRAANRLGMTIEEYRSASGYEIAMRSRYQKYMQRQAKQYKKKPKPAVEPDFEEWQEDEPNFEPPPQPEDAEDFEDESNFEPDWSSMSKADLVVAMLNMMPDSIGKQNLRKLLSEIPSDDYPELASTLWNMPEALRNGYVIKYHDDVVNQRRASEQEFMKSKEFEEEVGGAVDPKSWM